MTSYRTDKGAQIDRSHTVQFRWAGKHYQGYRGDTLASALLANGVRLVGRSFKYHRPRGLLAAGLDEPNAIVQLERGAQTIPNLKAPYVELYDALDAGPVNAWPSLEFDLMAVNGLFKRFIPAAFYYKTFMWPNWLLFEPAIRKAAGLGTSPTLPDPDIYAQTSTHCDTLVVGGGIAGIAAALAAGQAGKRTMLVTGGAHWGGRLAGADELVEGRPAREWIDAAIAALAALPNVTLLNRTLATGHYDHGMVALCERLSDHLPIADRKGARQRLWRVRAGEVVSAIGAFERPLVFSGNDRPGVMLAGAALAYLRRYGVVAGKRIVVATTNDSAWAAAFELADAGGVIAAIIDARPQPPVALVEAAAKRAIPVHAGCGPEQVSGSKAVRAVSFAALDGSGRLSGTAQRIACDTVLMSGGWNPAVHLHSHAGGSLRFDERQHSFLPTPGQSVRSVGGAAGDYGLASALSAARGTGQPETEAPATPAIWSLSRTAEPSPTAWVDFQNDVTAGDVALATRESFRSVEHLKRYTTLGMASDQGKTSNVNGIGILSQLIDKAPQRIGTTRFRPPFDPTTIGTFAGHRVGDRLQPRRPLAATAHHIAADARIEEYGGWMRPAFYPLAGEDEHAAINREVGTVRNSAGMFEASPLGKIEVKGPDAATLLDRIYVNTISTLKVGRCRYGLMLNENGTIYDDGVVTRLADDHFLVGTTSGHASAVAGILEEWLQCEWVSLQVLVQDVTTCWAVVNIAGPNARAVLEKLDSDIDFGGDAFPHMTARTGQIIGVPTRIARVSFSGELSYEVAVPWQDGDRLWAAIADAGAGFGIAPFGVEALMTMRIEKGFLHVGSETDGATQPQDVGFGAIVKNKKSDFVGRRSTMRPDSLRADRQQFVGLTLPAGDMAPLAIGAHVVAKGKESEIGSDGWVTSSTWSPTLGRPVALAMIKAGNARMGETVQIFDMGKWRTATIAAPCSYDPEGARLNG